MRIKQVAATVAITTVILGAAVWAGTQATMTRPVPPVVLSGNDVGFRIEGERNGRPVGTLVVKQNGQWVVAEVGPMRPHPISH